jgi:hypothetical protein
MKIDPDWVGRERAALDVAISEIMRPEPPLTLEAALRSWASRQISGTITAALGTDAAGRVMRRTSVADIVITGADGLQERLTTAVTVERRRISP